MESIGVCPKPTYAVTDVLSMIILDESLRDSDSLSSMLVQMYATLFQEDSRLHILCDKTGKRLAQLGAETIGTHHQEGLQNVLNKVLPDTLTEVLSEELEQEISLELVGKLNDYYRAKLQKVSVCSLCLNKLPLFRISFEFAGSDNENAPNGSKAMPDYGYAVIDLKTGLFLDYNSHYLKCSRYDQTQLERARYTELGHDLAVTHGLLYSSDQCYYQSTLNPEYPARYWTVSQKLTVQGRDCLKLWILPQPIEENPTKLNEAEDHEPVSKKKTRVLVVDDELLLQQTCSALLEHLNCDVKSAMNGKKALEILEQQTFDLVLLDMNMPFLNGFDTARLIRNSEKTYNDIPIVAMTGANTESDTSQAQFKHFDSILHKPFAMQQLVDCLDVFRINQLNSHPKDDATTDSQPNSQATDYIPTLTLKQFKDQPDILSHLRLTFIQCLSTDVEGLEAARHDTKKLAYLLSQISGMALNMGAQALYRETTQKEINVDSLIIRANEAIDFYKDIDWKDFLQKKDDLETSLTIAA